MGAFSFQAISTWAEHAAVQVNAGCSLREKPHKKKSPAADAGLFFAVQGTDGTWRANAS
jgi:hypothetical protein